MDKELLRKAIKTARIKRGMTLEVVAKSVNSSIGYIHEIEAGLKTPSVYMLGKLTDVLGLQVSILSEVSEDGHPDGAA